jgi:hypothetical protein
MKTIKVLTMAKGEKGKKLDFTTLSVVILFVIIVALAFYIFGGKKENNFLKDVTVLDLNVTCTAIWRGAETFVDIYNLSGVPPTAIVWAECRVACEDEGLTLKEYKCTPDDQFLCYCNKKK